MGILDTIFSDPSSAGGGWLYQLLGGMKSNPGALTSTPTTPPPVQSALGLPFAPHQGLLGNSLFGDAVRGGLAGLQGSTGYSGFGAQLGAGAQAGTQALRQRQQFQMENMLAGQRYQSGNQNIMGGNLDIASKLRDFNIWDSQINPNHQDLTYSDLQDPAKLSKVMSFQMGGQGGQPAPSPAPTGGDPGAQPVAPQLSAGTPMAPPPASGSQPIPQGQPMAQGQPPAQGQSPDALAQAFAQYHYGKTPKEWAKLGMLMRDPTMIKDAEAADSSMITGVEAAKAAGTPQPVRPGTFLSSNGQMGAQNPTVEKRYNASTDTYDLVHVYPDGRVVPLGTSGQGSGGGSNNPGNIRSGANGTFGNYSSMGAGVDAIDKNLQSYGMKGINTLSSIVSTWAPSNENDTQALIANAAKRLGIDPNKPLNMSDANTRAQIAMALMQQENGLSSGNSGSGSLTAEAGPATTAALETRGKNAEDTAKAVDDAAASAVDKKFAIDQMQRESQSWEPGKFANWQGNAQAYLQGIRTVFGLPEDPSLNQKLGDYQAFNKNAVNLVAQLTKSVSPRASYQEMGFLKSSMPNAAMSRGGMTEVFAQLGSVADFQIAKQRAQQAYRDAHGGSVLGFETDFNRNVSPTAIWFGNLPANAQQEIIQNAGRTAEGKKMLGQIQNEIKYIQQNGLMQ